IERGVVIPAVPQDDVPLLFRLMQDRLVIDAGIDGRSLHDVRLVFLPLLDGAVVAIEVGERAVALRALRNKIAIGHGMTDHDGLPAHAVQLAGDASRDRALAAAGANRAD